MDIVYDDKFIIVCVKPAGVLSAPDMLNDVSEILISRGGEHADLVHRLDYDTGGLMIFSKKKSVTAKLSRAVSEGQLRKEYLTVIKGVPGNTCGEMRDFLFKDSSKNRSYVVKRQRKGVREALLRYRLCETVTDINGDLLSLVKIRLLTGRTHQIRVQFSSRKLPLIGDGKYGGSDNRCKMALWSHRLSLPHPVISDKKVDVSLLPPDAFPWNLFDLSAAEHVEID